MPFKHLNEDLREAYIDGKLNEDESSEVEEHLLTCSACFEEYNVDLPKERAMRAFAFEHRELGQKVLAAKREPGLKVRLGNLADKLREGVDEVQAVLENFVNGARIAYLVPQMANVRGPQDNAVVIDQMCRDFVLFSGQSATAENPDALGGLERPDEWQALDSYSRQLRERLSKVVLQKAAKHAR